MVYSMLLKNVSGRRYKATIRTLDHPSYIDILNTYFVRKFINFYINVVAYH